MRFLSLFPASIFAYESCETFCKKELEQCFLSCDPSDFSCPQECLRDDTSCRPECAEAKFAIFYRDEAWTTNFRMDAQEDLTSEFDFDNHDVDYSCTVEHKGSYYLIGGFDDRTRVSIFENCGLRKVTDLEQNHQMHRCRSFQDEIWICGDKDRANECTSLNTETLVETTRPSSEIGHLLGGLVDYQG
ncbi:Oidioi.mRNA.OKI2018_I69.chr2.g4242.t1.cds [Oikopleura dioica]|uniref:Oidioi.mRNA.OKI2018_I69.chr2.g4242.t1.cds n=1 Tax=Oikopleura dioica TaxID=34765 RepID=A0ABN7T0Z0_OIKDI|nr:Oidioi.mRNA.OKI2018_I69.chr2.g4242.t1.cds [Oikopleura dioica]